MKIGLFMAALALTAAATERNAYASQDSSETAILVKKGTLSALAPPATEYQIVDGKDELAGDPEFDRGRAYASWRNACRDWKQMVKDLNKENSLLVIHCGAPKGEKDGDQWTFRGPATYKIKVKTREKG